MDRDINRERNPKEAPSWSPVSGFTIPSYHEPINSKPNALFGTEGAVEASEGSRYHLPLNQYQTQHSMPPQYDFQSNHGIQQAGPAPYNFSQTASSNYQPTTGVYHSRTMEPHVYPPEVGHSIYESAKWSGYNSQHIPALPQERSPASTVNTANNQHSGWSPWAPGSTSRLYMQNTTPSFSPGPASPEPTRDHDKLTAPPICGVYQEAANGSCFSSRLSSLAEMSSRQQAEAYVTDNASQDPESAPHETLHLGALTFNTGLAEPVATSYVAPASPQEASHQEKPVIAPAQSEAVPVSHVALLSTSHEVIQQETPDLASQVESVPASYEPAPYSQGKDAAAPKHQPIIPQDHRAKKPSDIPKGPRAYIKRANVPIQVELPEAKEFKYDPEVYNERNLLAQYPKTFLAPERVDYLELSEAELISKIEDVVVSQGVPLVIGNFHKSPAFDPELFSLDWLKKHLGNTEVGIRNLHAKKDITMPFLDFLAATQGKPHSEIIYYGKDIDCPAEWQEAGKTLLPAYLQYLGPNDLNRLLPANLKVENFQIYVGHEGTHTSSHFDICASVGHNLMVHADDDCSALWFMVGRDNADRARKFWYHNGGGNTSLDQDNCSMPADVMGQADFPIYCFEQRLGDFVLVPSECAHQVVNLGRGTNIKYSWNRNTAQSLAHCIRKVLPVNRRILKMETYRTKAMVEMGVREFGSFIWDDYLESMEPSVLVRFAKDFRTLLQIYAENISEEVVDSSYQFKTTDQPIVSDDSEHHGRVCDYCRCDIWNSWFHCGGCKSGGYGHDYCINCFAEWRRCPNYQSIQWFCLRPIKDCFKDLQALSDQFNNCSMISSLPGFTPVPIYRKLRDLEGLHTNLFSPITLAVRNNENYKIAGHKTCHQCAISRFYYDMVQCTNCKRSHYCQGCISNRYAVNPHELARQKQWRCYMCEEICNCAKCVAIFTDTIPLPENPFRLKDYNGNYHLGYGLSYFPVGKSKYLQPNLVDCQTFLAQRKGMEKATCPKIQAKLLPFSGTLASKKRPLDSATSPAKKAKKTLTKSPKEKKATGVKPKEKAPPKRRGRQPKLPLVSPEDAKLPVISEGVEQVLLKQEDLQDGGLSKVPEPVQEQTVEQDQDQTPVKKSASKRGRPSSAKKDLNTVDEGDQPKPPKKQKTVSDADPSQPKKRGRPPKKAPMTDVCSPDAAASSSTSLSLNKEECIFSSPGFFSALAPTSFEGLPATVKLEVLAPSFSARISPQPEL